MKWFEYELTDSTSDRAKEYAKCEGALFPAVFIAGGQTAGRGRMGASTSESTIRADRSTESFFFTK